MNGFTDVDEVDGDILTYTAKAKWWGCSALLVEEFNAASRTFSGKSVLPVTLVF